MPLRPEPKSSRLKPLLRKAALVALALFASATQAGVADLRAAISMEKSRPRPPQFDRIQFLAKSDLLGAWLSPDGRNVAYLRDEGRNRGVWLLPTAGGSPKRLLPHTEATQLSWSRDGRWLFLASPRQLFVLAAAGQAGSGVIAKLGGRWEREFETSDPVLPAAIVRESPPLVSRLPKLWRLYRIDVRGKQTLLHEDAKPIVDFAFDDDARLAFISRAEGDKQVVYRVTNGKLREAIRCVNLERCSLQAAGDDGSLLMNTSAGANFFRLARLEADGQLHTLHADPRNEADLDQIVLDPATRQPLIASYRSTAAANYGLTAESRRHVETIERRYPGSNLRIEVGRGAGARWLVHERSGSLKGENLHLYDPASGEFRDILDGMGFHYVRSAVPRLPEAAMARKIAFVYRGSDGMPLHGFVLLPPGVDPVRAPLVAHVHGGPFNLFRPEFGAQSQLLANRGYVVFEPNFRGSTGLGRDYMFAGKGDFGNGRVQRDIVDGVRYLLAQGIGDANKVGIVGASFGGYSALQGVTFQPELFKVGVAAVPPADFGWVLRSYSRSQDQMSRGIPLSVSMRILSLDPADPALAERLRAQSPIANARKMDRPVLLLAGGDDERVPIRSVVHYAAELKTLGKDVSLFVDAEGRHQLADPLTREAYLYLTEELLHRRLGGAAPKPPSKELRQHLKRNLLIAGSDFSKEASSVKPLSTR